MTIEVSAGARLASEGGRRASGCEHLAHEETVRFSQCWHKESGVTVLRGSIRSIKKAEPGFAFTTKTVLLDKK